MSHRVLMLCSQFRPLTGGTERQAERLAIALACQGVNVTILTPNLLAHTPEFEQVGGVTIRRFPFVDLSRTTRIPGIGPVNLLNIRRQVLSALEPLLGKSDLLHLHLASPMAAFGMQAAQAAGVPAICKVASAGERMDLVRLTAVGWGGGSLSRLMVSRLDRWIATTGHVRDSLLHWGVAADRISIIPNGTKVRAEPPEQRHNVRHFLCLGRLSTTAERDVETVIAVFDRLAAEATDVELAIVGSGDLYEQTAAAVRAARHASRIHLPGEQSAEPWLQWADCFIQPSRYEGLSNALLEAMAAGLPCIANDIPANREVLAAGQAGVLVPVGDREALLGALRAVIHRGEYAHALAMTAWERARDHYSIGSVADSYIDLYDRLARVSDPV